MNNINKIKNYWNKRAKSKFYKCTNDLNLQEKEFEILLDIIKPNNKLPLSPQNNFGNFNIEKLNNKKTNIGIKITIKNS